MEDLREIEAARHGGPELARKGRGFKAMARRKKEKNFDNKRVSPEAT